MSYFVFSCLGLEVLFEFKIISPIQFWMPHINQYSCIGHLNDMMVMHMHVLGYAMQS